MTDETRLGQSVLIGDSGSDGKSSRNRGSIQKPVILKTEGNESSGDCKTTTSGKRSIKLSVKRGIIRKSPTSSLAKEKDANSGQNTKSGEGSSGKDLNLSLTGIGDGGKKNDIPGRQVERSSSQKSMQKIIQEKIEEKLSKQRQAREDSNPGTQRKLSIRSSRSKTSGPENLVEKVGGQFQQIPQDNAKILSQRSRKDSIERVGKGLTSVPDNVRIKDCKQSMRESLDRISKITDKKGVLKKIPSTEDPLGKSKASIGVQNPKRDGQQLNRYHFSEQEVISKKSPRWDKTPKARSSRRIFDGSPKPDRTESQNLAVKPEPAPPPAIVTHEEPSPAMKRKKRNSN